MERKTVVSEVARRFAEYRLRGIWLPHVKVSEAPITGRNSGSLYLKSEHGDYLGKITPRGELRAVATIPQEAKEELRQFAIEGHSYLASIGRMSGNCCYCGRDLTDTESVTLGYGPICARHYGLPHTKA